MAAKKTAKKTTRKAVKKAKQASRVVALRRKGSLKKKASSIARPRPTGLEAAIREMATSGDLRIAARNAIRLHEDRGLAVVYKEADQIVRHYPNGRIEVIERVEPSSYQLPKHVTVIGSPRRRGTA